MRQVACACLLSVLTAGAAAQAPPPPPVPVPQGGQPPRPSVPGMPQRDEAAPKTGTAVLKGTVV
jgi:hypothetical protein